MRYASGKTRISKQIADVISNRENNFDTFVSMFCGGCSVETKLIPLFKSAILNDKQEYLIEMYKALQGGWTPPFSISEDEYIRIKNDMDSDKALAGFVGFGCSFGGKWWGGYGRHGTKDKHSSEREMCDESRRALLRDMNVLQNATFVCKDYRDIDIPKGSVVYADPPYANKMSAFGIKEPFDTNEFWEYIRAISKDNHVYVSELNAPDDFEVVWEKPVLRQLSNCSADNFRAVEKLFVYSK